MKTKKAAIEFGCESDRTPEESDELPVTVAARLDDLAHIVRDPELFESLGDGWVETAYGGNSRGKQRFERIQFTFGRSGFDQLLAC